MRTCDVSNRNAVRDLAAYAVEQMERLDIVVNSAGVNVVRRAMSELDPNDFDRIMAINCTGFYNVLYAVLPGMRQSIRATIRSRQSADCFNCSSRSPISLCYTSVAVLYTNERHR